MKNNKKHNNVSKKGKFKPGSKKRENKCIVTYDDRDREEYLTGFHKRKLERRKTALAEIKKKIKEEQIRVREQRHKDYLMMLKERTDALQEDEDDLEDAITATTESVQYDHPNHTVTVTTISELDLTMGRLLEPAANQANAESKDEEKGEEQEQEQEKTKSMPRKAGNPIMNKKIRSLNASLNTFNGKNKKRKGKQGGRQTEKKQSSTEGKNRAGRTSKWQRRRLTGKKVHHRE